MRTGMNWLGGTKRKRWSVLAAVAILSSVLVVTAQPSGAVEIKKSVNAICTGTDSESSNLLATFGGSLEAPLDVTTVVAPFVEPGQTDVPVSIAWSLNLSAEIVDTVVGLGVTSMNVKGAVMDSVVSGPTSTTVIEGRPPDQTVTLVKGQPFSSQFPAFNGLLKDIGGGGVIKISSTDVTFSVGIGAPLNLDLNLKCTTGALLASIPVKVAGSPDIAQIDQQKGNLGQDVTVDVLGKYVTNGTDKAGVTHEVDPSTLKVIDGPGSVQNGQLVIPTPSEATVTDTTFEVCAGTVEVAPATEGIDEVQRIRVFDQSTSGKRVYASTFKLGNEGEAGEPVWMVSPFEFLGIKKGVGPIPDPWSDAMVGYALLGGPHEWPTEAEMTVAVQSVPGIGAGNVTVTKGEIEQLENKKAWYRDYEIAFTGALAKQDVPDLKVAQAASWLPQEWLTGLTGALSGGGDGDGGGGEPEPPKYPIPDGLTAKEYLEQIQHEIDLLNYHGDHLAALQMWFELYLGVLGENLMSVIDINAALEFVNNLFPIATEAARVTQGEDPTPAQMQELCSQGVLSVSWADVGGTTTTSTAGGNGTDPNEVGQSFAG